MGRLLRQRTVSLLALLAACAVVPGAVIHFFGETQVEIPSGVHFFALGISAGLAAAAAVVLTVSGARRGDARSVLIGTAFSSMAALLCIHGLMTPGFLVGMNGLVAFAGAATLPVGGAVLALAVIPELRRPSAVKPVLLLQAVLLTLIVVLGTVGLVDPELVPGVPEPRSTAAWIALVVGLVLYVALGARAARTYLLTRRFADLTVVFGLVLLAVSLVPALLMMYYELGWWIGHGIRADRHRAGRRAGGARPSSRRPVAPADERPARQRARQRGRRLHGPDRARAARAAGREGRLHGRAHARSGAAGGPGGRGARPGAGAPARAGDRRPAPRRGQAGRAERDPAEAGRAHGRRVRRDQAPPRDRERPGARARLLGPGRRGSCSTITSGSTAAATRAGWARRTSTSRRASWPSATCSTRCCRSGSTATPGRSRTRWSLLKESGTKFDPACVDALERVIAREQDGVGPRAA